MFRIIDRYLLRQFVQLFLICFLSLYGLYVVIDAFGHLDHFVDHGEKQGGLLAVLAKYYSYRSVAFFDRTCGILALVAAMFTVTWIQRHNEMTALMAAGVSRLRVIRPVILAAVVICLGAAALRECVLPQLRQELAVDSKHLGGETGSSVEGRFDSQTGILLGAATAIAQQERLLHPRFILPRELATYGRHLNAAEAIYLSPEGDRPAGYLLRQVTTPEKIGQKPSLRLGNTPVVVTSHDVRWLKSDEVFVTSDLSFEMLAGGSTWRGYASTSELVRELGSPSTDLGSNVRVAVHARLLQPLLDATLLMLGLPLVVARGNRNPFIAIGLCLAVGGAFFLVVLGSQSLGSSGWLKPALAAWLPLLLFVPVAVATSDSLRR